MGGVASGRDDREIPGGRAVLSSGNPSRPARHSPEACRAGRRPGLPLLRSQRNRLGPARGTKLAFLSNEGRHFIVAILPLIFKEELMKSARFLFMVALIAVLLMPIQAVPRKYSAQEISAQDKQMMEMMMKYAMPGKNHELLKKYVGDWDIEARSWAKPGDEPMMSKGTQKNELIFDGRYVKCQFEGMMMGQKFMGIEIIGYDLFQNKYVTFWIDTMSTYFFLTTGTLDATGKVLTETGMSPDPMTGGMQKVKDVTTFMQDGKYKFEMFMVGPDGKEFKTMELLATRKM